MPGKCQMKNEKAGKETIHMKPGKRDYNETDYQRYSCTTAVKK